MMTLTIGRDSQKGQLRMVAGSQTLLVGSKQSVPMSVGREHLRLTIDDDGRVILKNLNVENDTYVNGVGVEVKVIRRNDKIELGNDRYLLDWEVLDPFMPKFADIRPMKRVWDKYQQALLDQQIKERRSNALRSVTGIFTMSALVLGFFFGRESTLIASIYAIAITVSMGFFIKSFIDSSKIPHQQQALRDSLPKKYVCPCCKHFLGNQSYDIVSQSKSCPHCKAIFIK
jgi:hypothetical protein